MFEYHSLLRMLGHHMHDLNRAVFTARVRRDDSVQEKPEKVLAKPRLEEFKRSVEQYNSAIEDNRYSRLENINLDDYSKVEKIIQRLDVEDPDLTEEDIEAASKIYTLDWLAKVQAQRAKMTDSLKAVYH